MKSSGSMLRMAFEAEFNVNKLKLFTRFLKSSLADPMVSVTECDDISEECMTPTEVETETPQPPPSAVVTVLKKDF